MVGIDDLMKVLQIVEYGDTKVSQIWPTTFSTSSSIWSSVMQFSTYVMTSVHIKQVDESFLKSALGW